MLRHGRIEDADLCLAGRSRPREFQQIEDQCHPLTLTASGQVVVGNPAKVVKDVTDDMLAFTLEQVARFDGGELGGVHRVQVADEQVVAPPTAVDGEGGDPRVMVTLSGPNSLALGDVIIGSGAASIGGQVESVVQSPDGLEVVYTPSEQRCWNTVYLVTRAGGEVRPRLRRLLELIDRNNHSTRSNTSPRTRP